jgi:peptidoglycan hydrolase CwlO-like protein
MTAKELLSTIWTKIKSFCKKFWKQITIAVSALATIFFFKKKLETKKEVKSLKKEVKAETKEIETINTSVQTKEEKISNTITEVNSAVEKTDKRKEDIKEFLPDL